MEGFDLKLQEAHVIHLNTAFGLAAAIGVLLVSLNNLLALSKVLKASLHFTKCSDSCGWHKGPQK